jgi:hypothetical protein
MVTLISRWDSIEKIAPDFDRDHFIKAAQPDTDG